jgi:hypothetical protein
MTMHASLAAIGRQLHAHYFPILAKPLPSELENLVARLFARESSKRGSSKRSMKFCNPLSRNR